VAAAVVPAGAGREALCAVEQPVARVRVRATCRHAANGEDKVVSVWRGANGGRVVRKGAAHSGLVLVRAEGAVCRAFRTNHLQGDQGDVRKWVQFV